MTTVGDLASIVRSKNAGPFRLTFDIFFPDTENYRWVRDSGAVDSETIADLYGIPEEDVIGIYYLNRLNAVKISVSRPVPAGGFEDTDLYGTQQHPPLLDIEITE